MKLLSPQKFKDYCNKYICMRKSIISKNCLKSHKQNVCYLKYLNTFNKRFEILEKELKDKEFRDKINERDKTCRVWNILNQEERLFILKNLDEEYILLSERLDVCHIIPRSKAPQLKYEEDNVFLASRYFHTLLDAGKDLVTVQPISIEETKSWITRIMVDNELWKEDYDSYYKRRIQK